MSETPDKEKGTQGTGVAEKAKVNVVPFEEVQETFAEFTEKQTTFEDTVNKHQNEIEALRKQLEDADKTKSEALEEVEKRITNILEEQKKVFEEKVAQRKTDYTIEDAEAEPEKFAKDCGFGSKVIDGHNVSLYEDIMTRKIISADAKNIGFRHEYSEIVSNTVRKIRYYNDLIVLDALKNRKMIGQGDKTRIDPEWYNQEKKTNQYIKRYIELAGRFEKALSTTTGYGGDWVPTGLSAEITDLIELQPTFANFFDVITMPTSPYDYGRKTSRGTWYGVNENTANEGVKYPASNITTGKATFTAVKFACRIIFSDELAQDSLPNIYNIVVGDMAPNAARNRENVIINGDESSPHMDSNVTNANDALKFVNGLRDLCASGSDSTSVGDYATAVKILTIRDSMGVYGANSALVVPMTVLNYLMVLQDDSTNKNRVTITADGGGGLFTVWNGIDYQNPNRSILGMKLYVSEFIGKTTNSSGVYQSGQTKTMFFICNQQGHAIGSRKLFTLESDRDIETGQTKVVAMDRWDFQKMYATAEPVAWEGYNVTSGVA